MAVSVLVGALLLVAPRATAGGGCHRSGEASGSGSTVELSMSCMNPTVLHTDSHEVTFVNRDAVTHNVWGALWGHDELKAGESFTQRFTEGTHLFACTLHPGMAGAVVVGESDATLQAAPAALARGSSSNGGRFGLGLAVGAALGALGAVGVRRALSRSAA